jgi:hypothetical protein
MNRNHNMPSIPCALLYHLRMPLLISFWKSNREAHHVSIGPQEDRRRSKSAVGEGEGG